MDNYNVLVLMLKDRVTNMLTETVDSYTIKYDMDLIESAYLKEEEEGLFVTLTLTTKDVEDWQYYGVYDLYDEEILSDLAAEVLDGSGEYNPRWIIKLRYVEDRIAMEDLINQLLMVHSSELHRIMPIMEENKEKYQNEAENED